MEAKRVSTGCGENSSVNTPATRSTGLRGGQLAREALAVAPEPGCADAMFVVVLIKMAHMNIAPRKEANAADVGWVERAPLCARYPSTASPRQYG